ncbi:MAG: hypothetical protein ACRBBZ_06575 [Nitrosopumilus sp.]
MKKSLFLVLILSSSMYILLSDFSSADASKTGSYNFCSSNPTFPECTGWRTNAITDNYWFCDYVSLKEFCKNTPDPEKQIPLRTQDFCCRYIGGFELKRTSSDHFDQNLQYEKFPALKDKQESLSPLIVWTDKDHYNFRDKVIVYGKFDFTNPSIIQNIYDVNFAQTGAVSEKTFTVDIKLNGKIILRNIPVSSNGWFSAFFFNNNPYTFSTQNNLLEVDYIITQGVIPPSGSKTHAIYQFTTGDIAKKEDNFEIWLDNSTLPNEIHYGVNVENPEKFITQSRYDLVISRLITPEGYVLPINSDFTIQDVSTVYSKFREYGHGTYEIQITYGNNTSKASFEY